MDIDDSRAMLDGLTILSTVLAVLLVFFCCLMCLAWRCWRTFGPHLPGTLELARVALGGQTRRPSEIVTIERAEAKKRARSPVVRWRTQGRPRPSVTATKTNDCLAVAGAGGGLLDDEQAVEDINASAAVGPVGRSHTASLRTARSAVGASVIDSVACLRDCGTIELTELIRPSESRPTTAVPTASNGISRHSHGVTNVAALSRARRAKSGCASSSGSLLERIEAESGSLLGEASASAHETAGLPIERLAERMRTSSFSRRRTEHLAQQAAARMEGRGHVVEGSDDDHSMYKLDALDLAL